MKAARDRDEEFYDPARKEDILGRTNTRLELWEEHLKDLVAALAKALECLETACHGWHLVSQFVVANLRRRKDVGRVPLGRGLASSGPVGCCWFAHNV